MQDIVIYGCGGFGREVLEWVQQVNEVTPSFHLAGFLDADPAKWHQEINGQPVLGDDSWLTDYPGFGVILGIGSPSIRSRVLASLEARPITFPTLRHPTALIGRDVAIGHGAVICPGAIVTTNVKIGTFSILNLSSTVGHDSRLGNFVTLAPGVHLSGYTVIGDGCDLGSGATTVPGVAVGAWSIVGAGTVVTENLPPNCTAVGAPARIVRQRAEGWQRS